MKLGWNTDSRRILALSFLLFAVTAALADDAKLSGILKQADALDAKRDTAACVKLLEDADKQFPKSAEVLYRLAKQYSDGIFDTKNEAAAKALAEKCLATARRAVEADPKCAKAHLSVAVCYAKNFPYCDNQTRVNWSRALKEETERAITLDPSLDLAYHMLGRWHYEVADMSFVTRAIAKVVYGGLPKASFEDALANFKKAADLAPKRVIHRLQLAKTYLALGKKKEAIAELQLAVSLEAADKDDEAAKNFAAARLKKMGVKAEVKQD